MSTNYFKMTWYRPKNLIRPVASFTRITLASEDLKQQTCCFIFTTTTYPTSWESIWAAEQNQPSEELWEETKPD